MTSAGYSAPVSPKFCKSLLATGPATGSSGILASFAARFFDKALYEFWGFCINGGSSLTQPGGIVGISYPAGFQSGSLLGSATDGATTFGTNIFGSQTVDFGTLNGAPNTAGELIGKYLVCWQPDEVLTDDSIYLITAVPDPQHIEVDISSGGTRRLGNHPWFWDRQNINFRIVDIEATCALTGWAALTSSAYMVLQFDGAPAVNVGQNTSQFMFHHATGALGEGTVGLTFSPSGTWNGSAFTDGTSELLTALFPGSGSLGEAEYTFIAQTDFLIAQVRGTVPGPQGGYSAGSGFHIEVPQRMYSESVDPNPLAWVTWANLMPSQVAAVYYNGFQMIGYDGNVHAWKTLVRSPMGTLVRADYTGNAYGAGQWQQFGSPPYRFAFINYDSFGQQFITTDGVLSLSTPGQFSMARARLRRVRFTTADLPYGARLGDLITDTNAWVHVSNGVVWPWDDSIMPEGPWRFGV